MAERYSQSVNTTRFIEPKGTQTANASISTATDITLTTDGILIQAVTDDVYYTLDGTTTPTTANGFILYAGHPPTLIVLGKGAVLKVISASGGVRYQMVNTNS